MIKVCIILTICIAYIYHIDAPNRIFSSIISLLLKKNIYLELKKPFGCPLCMTFWISLILLLICSPQICWLSLLLAFSTKYIDYSISIIELLLDKIFVLLERLLNLIK
jgi:hypothetical protein